MSIYTKSILVYVIFLSEGFLFAQENNWTLQYCIEQGWKSNIAIQQSELNTQNAAYDLEKNRAAYYPNLNASYTNGFNWGRSIDPTSYQFVNGRVNTNNVSLTSRVTIFDGFVTPTRIQQSRVGLQMAQSELDQRKNYIAMSIASAYLQILLAYEKISLITTQLISSRELLRITKKHAEVGLKSELDVLQIKSQIAYEIADSVQAQSNLHLSKLSLLQLMEIPYGTDFSVERFSPEPFLHGDTLSSPEIIYDSAVNVMPEIHNADLSVNYSQLEIKTQKGAYYPVLSLSGSIGTNYASSSRIYTQQITTEEKPIGYLLSDPSELVYGSQVTTVPVSNDYPYFDQLNNNFSAAVSINLTIPIYNRHQVLINTQKAQIGLDQSELELQNQKNLLRKDIETDYMEYVVMTGQLNAATEKLIYYNETYSKMLRLFELESSTSYNLLLEKNKVFETENEIVQLQYQILFKYIILNYYQTGNVQLPIAQ